MATSSSPHPTGAVDVNLALDDWGIDHTAEVVAHLRAAGLRVHEVMETTGVVTGDADRSSLPALAAVEGVATVEEDRVVGPL